MKIIYNFIIFNGDSQVKNKKVMQMPTLKWYEEKILSYFPYEVERGNIILGKKRYTFKQLGFLSYIVRFLSVMLFVTGIIRIKIVGGKMGFVRLVIAVLTFLWGMIYKIMIKKAKRDGFDN